MDERARPQQDESRNTRSDQDILISTGIGAIVVFSDDERYQMKGAEEYNTRPDRINSRISQGIEHVINRHPLLRSGIIRFLGIESSEKTSSSDVDPSIASNDNGGLS